jgi:hypothetical protein
VLPAAAPAPAAPAPVVTPPATPTQPTQPTPPKDDNGFGLDDIIDIGSKLLGFL